MKKNDILKVFLIFIVMLLVVLCPPMIIVLLVFFVSIQDRFKDYLENEEK
jgi:hypothetical protein